jgi:large subunit ribosomal protein L10
MRRDQKEAVVEEIAGQIAEAEAIYASDYRGLSVSQAAALRASLRGVDATFRVVKNTLTLRAADKAGAERVNELVEGPTAFTFVHGDPAAAAKALDSFARQEQVLVVRGGLLNGELLSAEAVRDLARLPGRDRLNAQLAGVVAAPLTGLVRGLGSLLSGLAVALGQVKEKKEAEGPAPQETETAAAEPPEAEGAAPQAAAAEPTEAEGAAPQEPEAAAEPTEAEGAAPQEPEAAEEPAETEGAAAEPEGAAPEGEAAEPSETRAAEEAEAVAEVEAAQEEAPASEAAGADEAQDEATEDQAEASEKEAE